ncbi:MAG: hypothetical protein N3A38_04365 [Planctomycetota bacterium]|nr:hypothetical protein [Planctomycetota bacterium]
MKVGAKRGTLRKPAAAAEVSGTPPKGSAISPARGPAKKPDTWGEAALAGCDWFVASQVIQKRPCWDANHGRFMYNVHIPTLRAVQGLVWTQARAAMCLIAAYKRTGDGKYLESAKTGLNYVRILQDMDARHPLTYGAFHEETPHSTFSYPRDAIEAADALLQWHSLTGDRDALYRVKLFMKWFRRNAWKRYPGFGWWVRGSVRFDDSRIEDRPIPCEMGCATVLAHAFLATREPAYRTMALRIADSTIRNYLEGGDGFLRASASCRKDQHVDGRGIVWNDDGGGVGLLNAHLLSGKRKYLDAAIRLADRFAESAEAIPIYSGIGAVANFLLETDRVLGENRYRSVAERLGKKLLDLQVADGSPLVRGAFRGEDEGGKWYVEGSENGDFVTTRVTAYAVLTLFKLEGAVWPEGYSVGFR